MNSFWKDKKILITGHTGFKGSWLSMYLTHLGARVSGFALEPPTNPSLFEIAGVEKSIQHKNGDVRDLSGVSSYFEEIEPEIVIHMAAQPLVRDSYKIPVETYATNVMGTVNLCEVVRQSKCVKVFLNITTDKCYENKEWVWGYRENETLGGYDPYSNSKACSELVTAAYRSSYFNPARFSEHGVAIATARAGNVIGGGDWAYERLVCDCIRALLHNEEIVLRNPDAVRPWQYVLEPLRGYMMLVQQMYENGGAFSEAFNFGPDVRDAVQVEELVSRLCKKWGGNARYSVEGGQHPHEARYLKLDCSKAKDMLAWHPKWNLDKAIDAIIDWTRAYTEGKDMHALCLRQIEEYMHF